MDRRFRNRDPEKPWVFWHSYWSLKAGCWVEGPYQNRKLLMKKLCKKAGVKYFRFHALRHAGASIMDNSNIPIGSIQRILGHESRNTTEIYLHSIGDAERVAISVLERPSEDPPAGSPQRKMGVTAATCNSLKLLVRRQGIEP